MLGKTVIVVMSCDCASVTVTPPELNDVVIGVACHCTARQWTAK